MSAENVYPQQKELSLDLRNVTISKVISEIEKRVIMCSHYDEAQLELNKKPLSGQTKRVFAIFWSQS